jgi:hypothetical protein
LGCHGAAILGSEIKQYLLILPSFIYTMVLSPHSRNNFNCVSVFEKENKLSVKKTISLISISKEFTGLKPLFIRSVSNQSAIIPK